MAGEVRTIPPKVVLNTTERVLESGKLLYIIQKESGSCAASALITDGIEHINPKEVRK